MNTYTTTFTRDCPINSKRIAYTLEIQSRDLIAVEGILAAIVRLPREALHEAIADLLASRLPGLQTLRAFHHGVHITTERGVA